MKVVVDRVSHCLSSIILLSMSLCPTGEVSGSDELIPIVQYKVTEGWNGQAGSAVSDLSGSGHHGSVKSANISLANDRPKEVKPSGSSFDFGAQTASGYIVTKATNLMSNFAVAKHGGFTFDVWFKMDGPPDKIKHHPVLISRAGTEQLIGDVPNNSLRFTISKWGATVDAAQSLTELADGEWHHVRAQFVATDTTLLDPLRGDIYITVDGVTRSTSDVALAVLGEQRNLPIALGQHPENRKECDFDGLLHNPTIYLGADPDFNHWVSLLQYSLLTLASVGLVYFVPRLRRMRRGSSDKIAG